MVTEHTTPLYPVPICIILEIVFRNKKKGTNNRLKIDKKRKIQIITQPHEIWYFKYKKN